MSVFKNYFNIAIRNLAKQKMYSLINILGLAIGLAGCLLIIGYLYNELSYESCHVKNERIYRVAGSYRMGGGTIPMANIMPPMGPAIKSEVSEAEEVVRFRVLRDVWVSGENRLFKEDNMLFADDGFFSVFTFPLIQGDSVTALKAPNSVVISQSIASKYFANTNPIGQTLNFKKDYDLTITGIMADIKTNTQLKTDFIASYSTLNESVAEGETSWMKIMTDYTYILMRPGVSVESLEGRFKSIIDRNLDAERADAFRFWLQPIDDIYLHSSLSAELQPRGNITYVYMFSIIAFLLLIIACINYINLITAKTSHRITEVGIRKVLGAMKMQLVKQFIVESIMLCFVSMLLGLAFFELARPVMESVIETKISFGVLSNPIFLLITLLLALVVGILSGSYPAFYISRINPAISLKKGFAGKAVKSVLRRSLVVFQFVIGITLVFCTVTLYMQINYWQNKDLGFNPDNILMITLDKEIRGEQALILRDEILNNNRVINASAIVDPPGWYSMTLESLRPETAPEDSTSMMYSLWVDENFLETFEFGLQSGKNISEANGIDISRQIIIDEAAVEEFHLDNPVGQILVNDDIEYEIVGVVKEFHGRPLQEKIMPSMIRIVPEYYEDVAVKLYSDNIQTSLAGLEETWNKVFPDYPFETRFLSDMVNETHDNVRLMGNLFITFSLLVILIACLGVFGLSSYSAEQRIKEIGIRKVMGASEIGIVSLISREFIVLVGIASMIALPIGYLIMNKWIQTFAYRAGIGVTPFLSSTGAAFMVAILTVSYQAIKAARANPINAIQHE